MHHTPLRASGRSESLPRTELGPTEGRCGPGSLQIFGNRVGTALWFVFGARVWFPMRVCADPTRRARSCWVVKVTNTLCKHEAAV